MQGLTDVQLAVFEFVQQKLANGESAPTSREIAAHFGWAAKRAAECHIEALIRKGFLENEPGKARSLRLKNWAQTAARQVFSIPVSDQFRPDLRVSESRKLTSVYRSLWIQSGSSRHGIRSPCACVAIR